jgi:pyruvate/2-oxoglutarate dehydrogenase complex dihydrolipoamide acyltransferase (E2) component
MTVDTFAGEAQTDVVDTPDAVIDAPEESAEPVDSAAPVDSVESVDSVETAAPVAEKPKKAPAKKAAPKKTKTLELTLTVTGTADGEWKAELKQGNSYIAKNLLVAAAAVSRAAKELHEDLSGPIDEVIDAAREQQAAKVAALEAELEAARKALAELDD